MNFAFKHTAYVKRTQELVCIDFGVDSLNIVVIEFSVHSQKPEIWRNNVAEIFGCRRQRRGIACVYMSGADQNSPEQDAFQIFVQDVLDRFMRIEKDRQK
jgi:hypothetical protein